MTPTGATRGRRRDLKAVAMASWLDLQMEKGVMSQAVAPVAKARREGERFAWRWARCVGALLAPLLLFAAMFLRLGAVLFIDLMSVRALRR